MSRTNRQSGLGPVDRIPLREQVYEVILNRVVRGGSPPGARLSDSALAEDLNVSRTPVREALLRLEAEGFIDSDHMRGFFVPVLDVDEARDLYPLLWTLEGLALELGANPTAEVVRRMRDLNERFGLVEDALTRLQLDRTLHEELCAGSDNARLAEVLQRLRNDLLRYELAFMSATGPPSESVADHAEIIGAVEAGERLEARRLLEAHWRNGMETLLGRLAAEG